MRFVLLDTDNNKGIISALGENCVTIAQRGKSKSSQIDSDTLAALSEIAERNVTRRKIRFPRIFGAAPVAAVYRSIYRRKCLSSYAHFYKSLQVADCDCALVFNGYLAPNAIFELAARKIGIPMLFLENGFFPGTMQADPMGINALSSLPDSKKFYDALTQDDLGSEWPNTLVTRNSKLKPTDGDDGAMSLPSEFIFVPFQVPSDMQILALSPWIKDMRHMYDEVLKLARAFPHVHFVIKEHPSFPLSIQGKVPAHKNIRFQNHASTQELIEAANAVLTVNSTVGLEALSLGKKVITLGDAHYAIEDVTLKASDRAGLHKAVAELEAWQPDTKRREAFVRFVYNRFLLPIEREDPRHDAYDLLMNRATGRDAYSGLVNRLGEGA